MTIHPSVLTLAKRLDRLLPWVGLVSGLIYVFSLSDTVVPGQSAVLTAAAADLMAPPDNAHPLFFVIARGVASWPYFSLPVRMHLFSAFCATGCVILLYRSVARTILFHAAEDPGGGGQSETGNADNINALAMPPEVEHYNRRLVPIAAASGLIAAFLFALNATVWSAATRADPGPFDLMLALVSLSLIPQGKSRTHFLRLAFSMFFFSAGVSESAVFLFLTPCFVYLLFRLFVVSHRRSAFSGFVFVGGLTASLLAVSAFGTDAHSLRTATDFLRFLQALAFRHYHELRGFFPRSGWLLILIQTTLSASILLFGKNLLFKKRTIDTFIALALVAVMTAPGLLNLPFSPFTLFRPSDHLPVFCASVLSSAMAFAIASCLILRLTDATADERSRDRLPW